MALGHYVDVTNLTYAGKEANEILAKPIYESNLYNMGISYRPGVKGKEKIVKGDVGDLFQAYSCAFSPNGEVVLSEEFIEPFNIKINLEECYDKFWGTFLAEETRIAYAGEGGIPRTFFEWFYQDVLIKEMKKEYEDIFFNGDTTYTGLTRTYLALGDGVVKKVKAATGATKFTNGGLTVNNILAKIAEVAASANSDVDEGEYKIFMNYGQVRMLKTALGNEKQVDNLVWSNFTKDGDKIFAYGFEVVPTRIEKDTILLAPAKNMILGFDLESDAATFQLLDMSKVNGDNSFRTIALTNMAVGVVYPELFVLSTRA